MNPTLSQYEAGLTSNDATQRSATIHQIVLNEGERQLSALMELLFQKRIGNGVAIAIQAMGDSNRSLCIPILIDAFGPAHDNEKHLIIQALLKLGAFEGCFPGSKPNPNIEAQLWSLLFGSNSNQLRNTLALSPTEFEAKLKFAWQTTKHWRK
jgi:hypothetical protein